MHRRSFLTGIATSLLAGTAAARAAPMALRTWMPAGKVYGRSPAMMADAGGLTIEKVMQAKRLLKQHGWNGINT